MRSEIEVRSTIYRMLDVLYWLELMDWDTYCDAWYAAREAYEAVWDGADDAYFKKLNEVRDEI